MGEKIMSRANKSTPAFFGCDLPPGWMVVDGKSSGNSETISQSFPQMLLKDRAKELELEALAGNDPLIDLERYAGIAGGDFLFVGTSFLRSLLLCLQLATDNIDLSTKLPKLIIIDRSHFIVSCWQVLKKNVREIMSGDCSKLIELAVSLKKEDDRLSKVPENDVIKIVEKSLSKILPSIKKFNAPLIESILRHAVIICADWDNASVFKKISQISLQNKIRKIITYPSNIVECSFENPASQHAILDNIHTLSPDLSTHTLANFTEEEIAKGISYKMPSRPLYVEAGVESGTVFKAIIKFSITRAHEGKLPLPQKMGDDDEKLEQSPLPSPKT